MSNIYFLAVERSPIDSFEINTELTSKWYDIDGSQDAMNELMVLLTLFVVGYDVGFNNGVRTDAPALWSTERCRSKMTPQMKSILKWMKGSVMNYHRIRRFAVALHACMCHRDGMLEENLPMTMAALNYFAVFENHLYLDGNMETRVSNTIPYFDPSTGERLDPPAGMFKNLNKSLRETNVMRYKVAYANRENLYYPKGNVPMFVPKLRDPNLPPVEEIDV